MAGTGSDFINALQAGRNDRYIQQQRQNQLQFKDLASQYATATPDQRNALGGQLFGIDPAGAEKLTAFTQQQSDLKVAAQQKQDKQTAYKLYAVANAPPGQAGATYQAIAPEHYQQYVQSGAITPDTTDDQIRQFAQQHLPGVMAQAGISTAPELKEVTPGASLAAVSPLGGAPQNVYSAPGKMEKTDSGLNYQPIGGTYTDTTGKQLTSDEVAQREAQVGANKAALTTTAQNKAKMAALTPGSMDAMVESYMQTGQVPSGMSRNPLMVASFWGGVNDRAIKDGNSISAQMAQTRLREALKPAMNQTQVQLSQNQGFLNTLDKNIQSADQFAQKVGGDTSPALNNIFNKWKRGVTGDPDVAQFDVFNNAINGEAAKIASGSVNSSMGASDTQIKHQRENMNSAQNYQQWRAAANAMLQEGKNRIGSISAQRDSLLQQSQSTGAAAPAAIPTPQAPPAAGLAAPPAIQQLLNKYK